LIGVKAKLLTMFNKTAFVHQYIPTKAVDLSDVLLQMMLVLLTYIARQHGAISVEYLDYQYNASS